MAISPGDFSGISRIAHCCPNIWWSSCLGKTHASIILSVFLYCLVVKKLISTNHPKYGWKNNTYPLSNQYIHWKLQCLESQLSINESCSIAILVYRRVWWHMVAMSNWEHPSIASKPWLNWDWEIWGKLRNLVSSVLRHAPSPPVNWWLRVLQILIHPIHRPVWYVLSLSSTYFSMREASMFINQAAVISRPSHLLIPLCLR